MSKKELKSKRILKTNTKTFFRISNRLNKEEVEQGKAFLIKIIKKEQPTLMNLLRFKTNIKRRICVKISIH